MLPSVLKSCYFFIPVRDGVIFGPQQLHDLRERQTNMTLVCIENYKGTKFAVCSLSFFFYGFALFKYSFFAIFLCTKAGSKSTLLAYFRDSENWNFDLRDSGLIIFPPVNCATLARFGCYGNALLRFDPPFVCQMCVCSVFLSKIGHFVNYWYGQKVVGNSSLMSFVS